MPAAPVELRSWIDHLVVTSPLLQTGVEYVEQCLGVKMNPGGRHPRMGTHNAVLKLGERTYLEVIAIDPDADPVTRPRWFELDSLRSDSLPRLATWVLRTNSIVDAVRFWPESVGPIEAMSRGLLEWKITIPKDGQMPFAGVMPSLIEWATTQHPAENMPPSDVTLESLSLTHADAGQINDSLARTGFQDLTIVRPVGSPSSPRPTARLNTPRGIVHLE